MAYKKAELEKQINFTQAEEVFSQPLGSEKDLSEMFVNYVNPLMKKLYGVDVSSIEKEKFFDYSDCGLFRFRADFWIKTKCDQFFLVECKNPTHQFRENLGGITQLMAYKMALDYAGHNAKYLLVTSIFNPFILKFISDYRTHIDVLLLKDKEVGFWNYKTIQ